MNNMVRFRNLTGTPNVAEYGSTVEEFKLQRGKPDPNPLHSPMPATAVSETRLALATNGSDKLRLNSPTQPEFNVYDGPKMTLVLSRNAVQKLRSPVISNLRAVVQQGAGLPDNVQGLMADSMRRVLGMADFVDHLNGMAESIMVRSLAASKG